MTLKGTKGAFLVIVLFLSFCVPRQSFGEGGVVVMTLKAKRGSTVVMMNRGQLDALASQPGITLAETAKLTVSTQIAVPVPFALGGGFIVAKPEALAAGLNATGLTSGATAESVADATAARDVIRAGASLAATNVVTGVSGGTVAGGVLVAAGIAGAIIAIANNDSTTNH